MSGPGKRGRKSMLPEFEAELLNHVRTGASYSDACRLAGISLAAFMMWQHKGNAQKRGPYRDFVEKLEKARAQRRAWLRASILAKGKAKNDWRADAFIAQVTEREAFSQQVHVVVEEQLWSAIERLKLEFVDEPETLERALSAVAGEHRAGGTAANAPRPGAVVAQSGGLVDTDEALTTTVGVLSPRL